MIYFLAFNSRKADSPIFKYYFYF